MNISSINPWLFWLSVECEGIHRIPCVFSMNFCRKSEWWTTIIIEMHATQLSSAQLSSACWFVKKSIIMIKESMFVDKLLVFLSDFFKGICVFLQERIESLESFELFLPEHFLIMVILFYFRFFIILCNRFRIFLTFLRWRASCSSRAILLAIQQRIRRCRRLFRLSRDNLRWIFILR